MKKMFFAAIAAFFMGMSLVSCSCSGSSSPEDKVISCMKEMVSTVKSTHIKSEGDAKAFVEKIEKIAYEGEEAEKALEEYLNTLPDEEKEKIQKKIDEEKEKVEKEVRAEVFRLMGEAEEVGANLDM